MHIILVSLVLVLTTVSALSTDIPDHLLQEGHAIRKRFAEQNHHFHGHNIAYVLHEQTADTFHRISKRDLTSVTNKNELNRVRLDLNSGHSLHLTLRKRSIVDQDTEFYHNTRSGLVKREVQYTDCYATGHEGNNTSGMAAVSLCDGLHGTVTSNGLEYYIRPVEAEGGEHKVHVLWRRSTSAEKGEMVADEFSQHFDHIIEKRKAEKFDEWKTSDSFVIEMAMFNDARYWQRLQELVPGREDEYMLISMAAVQALYGDPEKVGYKTQIKVKLLVYWIVDPDGYVFAQDLETNLDQFCRLTRTEYAYDMHYLHTYITEQDGPAAGMAYVGGVCRNIRCANSKSAAPNRHILTAHEIGHNLGFAHHDAAECPDEVKRLGGGFMGGGDALNFSPCNKIELQTLFESGKGACLFEETAKVKVPKKYVNRAKVLPGQQAPPDELCELYVGKDYKYYRPFDLNGYGECALFLCINTNTKSPAFGNVVQRAAPVGFPCGDEQFCKSSSCELWDEGNVGWDIEYLRSLKKSPSWSSFPKKWGRCSRKCGTGVQLKQRKCKFEKKHPSVTPHCRGLSFEARLCNKKPCPSDPSTLEEIRQARGDEICSRFYENEVPLSKSTYLPVSTKFSILSNDAQYFLTKSCILSCERESGTRGNVDGVLPDGTPCLEKTRSDYQLSRFKIEMRCANGNCMEFSNCPKNERKDACGVCGGDTERCVSETITQDIPEGERLVLATIPAGTTGVDVSIVKKGGRLELWSGDGQVIIGKEGIYPKGKYQEDKEVSYAGTSWSYDSSRFLRADGPTEMEVVVKLLREDTPVQIVDVTYLLPNID